MSHHIAIDGIFSLNFHGSGPMKQLIMNTPRYQIDLRYWCQHTLKLSHIRTNMTPIEPKISSKLELHVYTVTHSTHNSGVINMRYINSSLIETILNFEVSAKNEGKFGFFARTKIMNFCISQKIKGMHVFNVEYHMCDGFEDKNQSTQNSGYPHIFSKFRTYNVKARGACLYSKLQPRVRMTESLFFYQYLRSDCPLSVQVSLCTLGAKCG